MWNVGSKKEMSQLKNVGISTVIPVYLDSGLPLNIFSKTIASVLNQTQLPRQIVVSDDSSCTRVEQFLASLDVPSEVSIKYVRNPATRGVSSNSNFGAKNAQSELLHFLHADDLLVDPDTYHSCLESFKDTSVKWRLLSGQTNGFTTIPDTNQMNLFGINSIGGPSSIMIRNSCFTGFDDNLSMLMDIEFVDRTLRIIGEPTVAENVSIEYGVGSWQIQRTVSSRKISDELIYLVNLGRLHKSDLRNLMSHEGMWEVKKMAISTLKSTFRINFIYSISCHLQIFIQILGLYFSNFKARIRKAK
jgi:glycosyltransferase involved in cell wall biosynthesis